MDVDKTYFSNITKRERAIFEGAISMGALFHQFVGAPVNKNSKKSLEISMEESLKLQPAIENVEVQIRFDKLEESMTEFDYTSLNGDMLDVRIYTKVDDVKAVIRIEFIEKVPSDGLCNKTDEDNLGFSYDALDRYIRTGICEDREVKDEIDYLHNKNIFKLQPIPAFEW